MNTININNNVAVEVANLPPSTITKLGCFMLATGLGVVAKGDAEKTAKSFIKQLYEIQDWSTLRRYGIKDTWLSLNPAITQSLLREVKKAVTKKVSNDPTVTSEELKFVKYATLFAENPKRTENALDKANKYAAQISPAFLRNFNKVVEKIEVNGGYSATSNKRAINDVYDEVEEVVADILGKDAKRGQITVPGEVIKNMRKSTDKEDLQLATRYRALKRQLSVNYDLDFLKFMSQQSDLVPAYDAYQYMDKLGYREHKVVKVAKTFPLKVGVVNGKLKYFTDSERPIAAGIPANATDIKLSRTYKDSDGSGSYLSYTTPGALGISKVYTEAHSQQAAASKFTKADKISENIDKIVTKWKSDLTSRDTLKQMAATAAYMIYLTGMRVGSRQKTAASATGEKTFGAISLRPNHITISGDTVTLKYKGKKGVEQKHIIKATGNAYVKRLAKNLAEYKKDKRGDTLVFSFVNERGTEKILTPHLFTQYLRTSGYPYGIHKLRHVRGTALVEDMLAKNTFKPSAAAKTNLTKKQKEAETFIIDKVISPATKLLGHRAAGDKLLWRTTVRSYIDPTVLINFFDSNGLRKPSWLPTAIEKE